MRLLAKRQQCLTPRVTIAFGAELSQAFKFRTGVGLETESKGSILLEIIVFLADRPSRPNGLLSGLGFGQMCGPQAGSKSVSGK